MEPCRFDTGCWRPLCPYGHSGRGRAARWGALWSLLAKQEVEKESPDETPQTQYINKVVDVSVVQLLQVTLKKDSTEVQLEQYVEFTTESSKSRADKETTALNDSERALRSNTTDTKSELQSAQSFAAEMKKSKEQYEEITTVGHNDEAVVSGPQNASFGNMEFQL